MHGHRESLVNKTGVLGFRICEDLRIEPLIQTCEVRVLTTEPHISQQYWDIAIYLKLCNPNPNIRPSVQPTANLV